jgi:hypothetical protein
MAVLKKALIWVHRYLGIPLSVLFIVWFVSGVVMMYAGGMPRLTAEARLARLPPLEVAAVRLTPLEAAERADAPRTGGRVSLLTVLGRPAYRFAAGASPVTVFADDGSRLEALDVESSRAVAARFLGMPTDRVRYVRTATEPDQWTLTARREFPLHQFRADDGAGTELYVSPRSAEVNVVTTSRSRALAWLGTIPHWLYFTPLRVNQPLWYWTVVWLSVAGCLLAVIGLVLGVLQFRGTRPFRLSASIPYRGWMRWHYISGVVFGIFTLTWVFSGLMSMEPFAWTNATGLEVRRDVFSGGPLELSAFPALDAAAWSAAVDGHEVKEIELARIDALPHYVARYSRTTPIEDAKRERLHQPYAVGGREKPGHLLIAADGLRVRTAAFDAASLLDRLRTAIPDVAIAEHELLTDYDSYYYSRARQAPLPVLRVKFADPMRTWVYVDPALGQVVAEIHRLSRLERWLFNGLHSLDFAFWYDRRPLWDIGMIVLSIGALVSSAIGLVLGVQRIRRGTRRALAGRAGDARA